MALTTSNMGLRVWNLLTDLFSHTDLAGNWATVDTHNHASGNGVQIPTGGIANAAVTPAKLSATYSGYQSGILASRPASPLAGTFYYVTDSTPPLLTEYNGTVWQTVMLAGAWQNLTLSADVTAVSGQTPAVRLVGDMAELIGAAAIGTSGITQIATLPTSFKPASNLILAGVVDVDNLGHGGGSSCPNFAITIYSSDGSLNIATASAGTGTLSLNGLSFQPTA